MAAQEEVVEHGRRSKKRGTEDEGAMAGSPPAANPFAPPPAAPPSELRVPGKSFELPYSTMAPPTTFVELGRRLRARTHDSASGGGGSGSHARIQQQGRDDDSDDEMVGGSPAGADASDDALDGDAPDGAVAAHLSAATGTADFFSLVSELPSELCIKLSLIHI